MASLSKLVPENVPGDYFVDASCIDCDACRQIAPETFAEATSTSFVHLQPTTAAERRRALHALLCCPTGSIGTSGSDNAKAALSDFPLPIEHPVFYCGFNSPKSFGGNSYFIQHPNGNWMVDSPKFVSPLVQRMEQLGGVTYIFLTHRDDVADAARYAQHFAARRIIDSRELDAQPEAEIVLQGNQPTLLGNDFLAIPTPGHSEGHCCLLFNQRFLFTGDHLAWNRDGQRLSAFRDYCWYSWSVQTASMQRLAQYSFEWVLPGHGQRVHLPQHEMARHLDDLVTRMRTE